MGWTIAGTICLVFQFMSWTGNRGIPVGRGGIHGIGFTIGANIGLVLAVIFYIIAMCRHSTKRTNETTSKAVPYSTQEKKFLCKTCGTYHTGWYQTCPTCGAVGTMEKVKQRENKQPELSAASIQNSPTLTLYGVTGAFAGAAIPVRGTLPVGTEEGNRILYPEGTQGISRRHCIITAKDSGVFISDCGSSYGTWINDTIRLQENQEVELKKGDKISLGSNQESFILEMCANS